MLGIHADADGAGAARFLRARNGLSIEPISHQPGAEPAVAFQQIPIVLLLIREEERRLIADDFVAFGDARRVKPAFQIAQLGRERGPVAHRVGVERKDCRQLGHGERPARQGMFRIERRRLLKASESLVATVFIAENVSAAVMCIGQIGPELESSGPIWPMHITAADTFSAMKTVATRLSLALRRRRRSIRNIPWRAGRSPWPNCRQSFRSTPTRCATGPRSPPSWAIWNAGLTRRASPKATKSSAIKRRSSSRIRRRTTGICWNATAGSAPG